MMRTGGGLRKQHDNGSKSPTPPGLAIATVLLELSFLNNQLSYNVKECAFSVGMRICLECAWW
jgi:hypothetical protein